MGPNNLPAPSSFPYVEVVARACQHQVAQLSTADGAVLWHLQGYKSHIDDTGTTGFMGIQNSVGFGFVFFYPSFAVAVNDFPAGTLYYRSFYF